MVQANGFVWLIYLFSQLRLPRKASFAHPEPEGPDGPEEDDPFEQAAPAVVDLVHRGKLRYAEALARRSLREAEERFGAKAEPILHLAVLLRDVLLARGKTAEPETIALCDRVVRLREARYGPVDRVLIADLLSAARAHRAGKDAETTARLIARCVSIEEVHGNDAPHLAPLTARLGRLGLDALRFGLEEPARTLIERALADREALLAEPGLLAEILLGLANLEMRRGSWPAARERLAEAVGSPTLCTDPLERDDLMARAVRFNLGITLTRLGEWGEALEHLRWVVVAEERWLGPSHPELGVTFFELAHTLLESGDAEAAREPAERALAIGEKARGAESADLLPALLLLAQIGFRTDDAAASAPLARRALAIRERMSGSKDVSLIPSLTLLARADEAAGDRAGARGHLERALAIGRSAWGATDQRLASTVEQHASLCWAMDDLEACRASLLWMEGHYRRELGSSIPLAATERELAIVAVRNGDAGRAEHHFTRALDVLEQIPLDRGPLAGQLVRDLEQVLAGPPVFSALREIHERAGNLHRSAPFVPPAPEA